MIGEKTTFRQQLEKLQRAGEEKRLKALQAKYPNPDNIDYGNMSLRDELQTRFDLDEMNNLSTKLGAPSGLAVGNDNGAPVQDLSQRLSGNDTEAQNSFYKPLSRPNKDNANCYMTFDGQSLNLVGGNPTHQYTLNAMSGNPDYQARQYQSKKYLGPIPEGTYYAAQNQRQIIDPINAAAGIINEGNWRKSIPAWGLRRVWLQPDINTNTYGRSGFSIHGGWKKGSAGCIDIPWQTGKLSRYLDDCQDNVPVYVKYTKEKW